VDHSAHWGALIKREAARLGFSACRIAQAVPLGDEARRLEAWLGAGHHGTMAYMERHFDLRVDPRKLVPGARSVVTLLLNYFPAQTQEPHAPRIARYAFGEDYHDVIRTKLNELLATLRAEIGAIEGRGFVDSAPVLERAWAQRSGLGWIGKNGNLLTREAGSFFFIATLITDLALPPDPPFATDHCGTCTRCLDACPTGAIVSPQLVDARKCISYLTIELKDDAPPAGYEHRADGWMFGCDVCQEVCPWNRFAQPHSVPEFAPLPAVLHLSNGEWEALSEEAFREIFRRSAIKRSKWKGVQRNLRALKITPPRT